MPTATQQSCSRPTPTAFWLCRWDLTWRQERVLGVLVALHGWLEVAEIRTDAGYQELSRVCCFPANKVGSTLGELELAEMVAPRRYEEGAVILAVRFESAFWKMGQKCSAERYGKALAAIAERNPGAQAGLGAAFERERRLAEVVSDNARERLATEAQRHRGEDAGCSMLDGRTSSRGDSNGSRGLSPHRAPHLAADGPSSAKAMAGRPSALRVKTLPESGSVSRIGNGARPPDPGGGNARICGDSLQVLRSSVVSALRPEARLNALKEYHKGIKPLMDLVSLKEALLAVERGAEAEGYEAMCAILGGVVMEGGDVDDAGNERLGDGGKWRNRFRTNRRKTWRVMAALVELIAEGKVRERGKRAEGLWKEFSQG